MGHPRTNCKRSDGTAHLDCSNPLQNQAQMLPRRNCSRATPCTWFNVKTSGPIKPGVGNNATHHDSAAVDILVSPGYFTDKCHASFVISQEILQQWHLCDHWPKTCQTAYGANSLWLHAAQLNGNPQEADDWGQCSTVGFWGAANASPQELPNLSHTEKYWQSQAMCLA